MHPVNKLNFGSDPNKIKVSFHNGSSVVDGYIVKQLSWTKWVVTADGVTNYTCKLAADGTPAAGEFTIDAFVLTNGVTGAQKQVKKIDGGHVTTTDGTRYMWTLGNPTADGYVKLELTT
jgi:hypothetical protein